MNFREFIARSESKDFDNPDEIGYKFADHFLEAMKTIGSEVHCGDCIKQPCSCFLCVMSVLIDEFREYTIDPKKYMIENYGE
jgi:hypothetical protein